jgi:hypothetical protein
MHATWNSSRQGSSKSSSPGRGRSKGKGKTAVRRTNQGSNKGKGKAPVKSSASPNSEEAQIKDFVRQVKQLELERTRENNIKWRRPW